MYIKVLQVLVEKLNIMPKSITIDFERAFINIKNLQIDKSLEDFNKLDEFFKYLQETWIGKEETVKTGRGRGVKTHHIYTRPLFDIELWSIHSRINDCLPRTNNYVEAWHNVFSNLLNKHPSIYHLVDKFREEQKRLLVQLRSGVKYKRKPNYIVLDELTESDPNEKEFTEKESKKPLVVLENENDNTFESESNSSTTECSIQVDQSSNEDGQQTASQNSIEENLE
ncbi:hypothetical protein BpHYR1_017342 [Brachionus plicatilis]|uniref:Uncharacterized protein n=1 Tax=Brachionus plicatilis TaxID=10195 RepID=A0A3M7R791_BRAPC|nr:hypothetical protein BpHYR1_017342 [Brachionus plicatilis]